MHFKASFIRQAPPGAGGGAGGHVGLGSWRAVRAGGLTVRMKNVRSCPRARKAKMVTAEYFVYYFFS